MENQFSFNLLRRRWHAQPITVNTACVFNNVSSDFDLAEEKN